MKVLKFGGTSVGKPERMNAISQLIDTPEPKIVVLSALSGTTNALVEIGGFLQKGDKAAATEKINGLVAHYEKFIGELYKSAKGLEAGKAIVKTQFDLIRSLTNKPFTAVEDKLLLAQGELLSTQLFHAYLLELGKDSALLPALDFMFIDADNEPVLDLIEEKIQVELEKAGQHQFYITQGYICTNADGEVDNLKRGGSDYSASLIGAAIRSEEVQIWTDIDGMHNNDPRIVDRTFPIAELSFDEAAELAYFGAKILHPSSVLPAQKYNIPVRLLNTMQPEALGTTITTKTSSVAVKALAAKDGITAIKIKSSRMLLAYGFLRKVFEIFEKYKTPVDLITTSEVAVSVTIDNNANLDAILNDLREFGTVEVDNDQSIICIVGNIASEGKQVLKKVFDTLESVPVRMVSFGGSRYNISLLVPAEYKKQALVLLNDGLFTWEQVAQ